MIANYKLINAWDHPEGIEKVIDFYHSVWGDEKNHAFFKDAFLHSSKEQGALPKLFCLLREKEIVGCCSLIVNDLISRQDLVPWIAGIYIVEKERGHGRAGYMMKTVEFLAKQEGFEILYLSTDLDGFYEKYDWERIEDGYSLSGDAWRIYKKEL